MSSPYAIIETGGKQYRVSQGDQIAVEKLPAKEGEAVHFDKVLLIGDNGNTRVGTPHLENAQVIGEVVRQEKGKKLIVYRFKRRKGYDKKKGHRQQLTRVRIKEIRG